MDAVEIIGYIATFMITICYIPQLVHTYRSKDVSGISLGMYCALSAGVGLWVIYSYMLSLTPLLICNGLSLGMILAILVMKLAYSKRTVSEMLAKDMSDLAEDIHELQGH